MTRRITAVVALAVAMGGMGIGYVAWASNRVDGDLDSRRAAAEAELLAYEDSPDRAVSGTEARDAVDAATIETESFMVPGEVLVVHTVPGDDYGRLAVRHLDGTRTLLDQRCQRVHVAAGNGICTNDDGGVLHAYRTTFFDATTPELEPLKIYSTVLPSRTRVSPSGTLGTTTGFVSGTSYEDIGGEASTIVSIDTFEYLQKSVALHEFTIDASDPDNYRGRQFWGVTFIDEDTFYVTGSFGPEPEIMHGSLSELTLRPTGLLGSCPSLSPDGSKLAYKRSRADGEGFDLVVVDLATDQTHVLGETRSVDDQVEWLDDDTILYAVHADDDVSDVQPQFDIWSLDIDPGSEPNLFMPSASSPATIR